MIVLLLSYLLLSTTTPSAPMHLHDARKLYEQSVKHAKACEKLIEISKHNNDPVVQGYAACAQFMMANHVIWPGSKYSYFVKGKNQLELLISQNPQHVELRYLRLTIQTNLPSFLNYNQHIQSDMVFLQKMLPEITDSELHSKISTYLSLLNKKQPV